jgi:hypothetical protein
LAAAATLAALLFASSQATAPSEADLHALMERQAVQLGAQARTIDALAARVEALEGRGTPAEPPSQTAAAPETQGTPAMAVVSGPSPAGRFPDDAVVRAGSFDRALTIPGTSVSLRFGGFVQGDVVFDRGEGLPGDAFTASAASPGMPVRSRSRVSGRNSRFNLDARAESEIGPFRVFIEGDFAGAGGSEIVSNGSALRLRHAFGQIGGLYVGQYWSAFVDVDAFPETLDPAGPAGKSTVRQAGVRYVARLDKRWAVAAAVENPELDAQLPAGRAADDAAPDLHAYATYTGGWGHLRLAGVARRLAVVDGDAAFGWALNLTGRVATPWLGERDNIVFGVVGGDGAGRYVLELAGLGLDAEIEADSGTRAISAWGGYAGAQHWWSPTVRSNLAGGLVQLKGSPASPILPTSLATGSFNLLWNPFPPVTVGAELLVGMRENSNGTDATIGRFQFTGRFGF